MKKYMVIIWENNGRYEEAHPLLVQNTSGQDEILVFTSLQAADEAATNIELKENSINIQCQVTEIKSVAE